MSGFPPGLKHLDASTAAGLLFLLTILFAVRVVGQALVWRGATNRLPAMSEWFSGLIPYPRLLVIQAVMLTLMSLVVIAVSLDLLIAEPRPIAGTVLLVVAWPYGLSMPVRYGVRMWRHPEARWTGRTIPIVFHVVLACWLFVLGSYLRPVG